MWRIKVPNLGFPSLTNVAYGVVHATFEAVVVQEINDPGLRTELEGKLFLQNLDDTRALEKLDPNRYQERDRILKRLIPVHVHEIQPGVQRTWWWLDQRYDWEYSLVLSVHIFDLRDQSLPCLFNLVVDHDYYLDTNYHAVYIREKNWEQFSFFHITDMHVSYRNDSIPEVIRRVTGSSPRTYINYNDRVRAFISFCNTMHKHGELDFILATGDLVDYVKENWVARHRENLDNFNILRDLFIGIPTRSKEWIGDEEIFTTEREGEELRVPIFTVLGNHDYRKNEYPLIHRPNIDVPDWWLPTAASFLGIPIFFAPFFEPAISDFISREAFGTGIKQYSSFGLTWEEAVAYGGVPIVSQERAVKFVDYLDDLPETYNALFNPYRDYVVSIRNNRIVCLDTGHDTGIVEDVYDYIFKDKSQRHFIGSSPDSVGFSAEQTAMLRAWLTHAEGAVIFASHAPLLNMEKFPHRFLRESLRASLTPENFAELKAWLDTLEDSSEQGWSFGPTGWFKQRFRDPELSWGTAANRFAEVVMALTGDRPGHRPVDLVLSGHTHQAVEYRLGAGTMQGRFFHDGYLDGDVGQSKSDSLSLAAARDVRAWWQQNAPVLVQTPSLVDVRNNQACALWISVANEMLTGMVRVTINDGSFALKSRKPDRHLSPEHMSEALFGRSV